MLLLLMLLLLPIWCVYAIHNISNNSIINNDTSNTFIHTIVSGVTNNSSNYKLNTNTYSSITFYIILNISDSSISRNNNNNIDARRISNVNIVCGNIHNHIINTLDIHTGMASYIIIRITNNNIMNIQCYVISLTIFLLISIWWVFLMIALHIVVLLIFILLSISLRTLKHNYISNNNSTHIVSVDIDMISPKIVDNINIINNTNIDNIIVIIIVSDNQDCRINSNTNMDIISNLDIISNSNNDNIVTINIIVGGIDTIVDYTIDINNSTVNSIVNYFIGNIINKYMTITTNPIIDRSVIHIIDNISINIINGNTYHNDTIIINLLMSIVLVSLLTI